MDSSNFRPDVDSGGAMYPLQKSQQTQRSKKRIFFINYIRLVTEDGELEKIQRAKICLC
jgi:hypothetical protein